MSPSHEDLQPVWHTLCDYICEEQIFIKLKEMKKSVITSVLAVLATMATVSGQNFPKEYLGLPGDNLNLYAVMDLFRNSMTLESFERSLNDRDNRINNLDLNGDYRVDYITVTDYRDGKVHNIVLRAILGRNEYQDVAVITVEKIRGRKVMIQLIGDEALYGRNYIIEPVCTGSYNKNYYRDPVYYSGMTAINNCFTDIRDWPLVVYLYDPHYRGWNSSWYWGYYPAWWSPWSPWYWDYYYGYYSGWEPYYYSYYRHSDINRYNRYNDYYYHSVRKQSPQVQHRIDEGSYRQTYSRPDQRIEGESLYNSTHAARVSGTRDQAPAGEASRRETSRQPAGVNTPATVTDNRRSPAATDNRRSPAATDNRRSPAAATSVSNGAAEVEAGRRAPAAGARSPESNSGEAVNNDKVRRSSAVTVSKEAEARETAAVAEERRQAESRAAESKAAEQRAAESRAAEQRAAEAREAQARETQARAAEQRAAEQRAAESRAAQQKAAGEKASEERRNEAAKNKTSESGTEKPTRR